MSEEAKKEEKKTGMQTKLKIGDFEIDVTKILPTIAGIYKQFNWVIPLVGFDVPPQVHQALITIAEGGNLSPDQLQQFKTMAETMERNVGEPVMTRHLAEDAWLMHQDGMGTREIAEELTKSGSPCSHSTVARWINIVDAEKRFSRIARIIKIGKILGFAGLIALAFIIGKIFF